MTIEELSFYQSHRDSYKIADNQFKCPICGKIFSVKAFSQHIRKEHYNKENNIKNSGGYNGHYNELNFKQKCSVAASINNEIRNKQKFGELKEFEVKCANPKCNNHFVIIERVKKFSKNKHYFCCRQCSKTRIFNDQHRKNISNTIKTQLSYLKINNPQEYARRLGLCSLNSRNNKKFTSKNERLIRDFIIKLFPNDEWTYGGHLIINNLGVTRDLYSNKLKICFEYDGIWHFKDIHNQLDLKQKKDKALEKWCIEHNYRLIRISESWFIENGADPKIIIPLLYDKTEKIIKCGKEYLKNSTLAESTI